MTRGRSTRPGPLASAMAACRRAYAGVGLFSMCLNLLMLATPLYMMQTYDRVLATGSIDTLAVLTVIVGAALVVLALLEALRGRVLTRVGAWLDRELCGVALSGGVAEALRAGGGMSAQALRDLTAVRGFLGGKGVVPLFDMPWAPVFLAIVFVIHPVLGWIGLAGAAMLSGCAVANDAMTRRKVAEANGEVMQALNAADAAIRNADAIEAMGMLPALVDRWRRDGSDGQRLAVSASDTSGDIAATAKAIRLGLQVAMLGVGAYLVLGNEMTAGGMIAAAIVLARGLAPVEQLIGAWRQLTAARTAWRRLAASVARAPSEAAGMALPRPEGRVDVEGLGYVPPRAREPVIRKVSFRLEPGEALGVIGPSGAGKTTLARLMVGSLRPSAGQVRLDGADMAGWASEDRGRHVGYLPQDVELFAGTVRENIARLGEAEDAQVLDAARLAGAHEAILGLPEGYETRIGDGGVPISGGQRQRIGLARALFGAPALVVLDEPDAHLDGDGVQAVIRAVAAMRERGTTLVAIGHGPALMASMDRILLMRHGRAERFGDPAEVLRHLSLVSTPTDIRDESAGPAKRS